MVGVHTGWSFVPSMYQNIGETNKTSWLIVYVRMCRKSLSLWANLCPGQVC